MAVTRKPKHTHHHCHEHYSVGRLEQHLRSNHKNDHDEYAPWEAHQHFIKVKDAENYAALIDVNPIAERFLPEAEVVFFGIEGSFKGCSMLSAILRADARASVVSVPSVSLWNCPELEQFTKLYLLNKVVVIVPDADWKKAAHKHPHVENQARMFQGRLLNLGVAQVHIAAPPLGGDNKPLPCWNERKGKMEELKGVDDFLGLGNGTLHELSVIDRDPPEGIEELIMAHSDAIGRKYYAKGIRTLANATRQLACFASEYGVIASTPDGNIPYNTFAKVMGVWPQDVLRYLDTLEEIGVITIKGSKKIEKGLFGVDWQKRPHLELTPEFRAKDRGAPTLGKLLGDSLGSPIRYHGGDSINSPQFT